MEMQLAAWGVPVWSRPRWKSTFINWKTRTRKRQSLNLSSRWRHLLPFRITINAEMDEIFFMKLFANELSLMQLQSATKIPLKSATTQKNHSIATLFLHRIPDIYFFFVQTWAANIDCKALLRRTSYIIYKVKREKEEVRGSLHAVDDCSWAKQVNQSSYPFFNWSKFLVDSSLITLPCLSARHRSYSTTHF